MSLAHGNLGKKMPENLLHTVIHIQGKMNPVFAFVFKRLELFSGALLFAFIIWVGIDITSKHFDRFDFFFVISQIPFLIALIYLVRFKEPNS